MHIGTWEVEVHTAGPHLTVEAKAMRLEWVGGLRKQRSVWQGQAAAGGEDALWLEASLSPHALLISLTPAGEAFAGRWQEGSSVTFAPPSCLGLPRCWPHQVAARGCGQAHLAQLLA